MTNDKQTIYLDNNATAKLKINVVMAMMELAGMSLNPSSIHSDGRNARKIIEDAKSSICNNLKISQKDYNIVFTSSGTESNNWVVKSVKRTKLIVSSIEHVSILMPSKEADATIIGVDNNGALKMDELENALKGTEKALISVMYANNETGVIQNIKQVIEIAKKYKAIVHSDLVQAIGKIPVNFSKLDLDLFTISAHKVGGPAGVSALFIKKGVDIAPIFTGGSQNQGLRAGTENVVGVHAMAKAIELSISELEPYITYCKTLRDDMEARILSIDPSIKILSRLANRLPNTSVIIMPNVSNESQLIKFDLEGILLSAGSACSSGKITTSHVIKPYGISEDEAKNAIRFSMSQDNIPEDIEKFIFTWQKIYKELKF